MGIILGWIPPFFRDIWSHKTSETLFVFVILVFSQYGAVNPHVGDWQPHAKQTTMVAHNGQIGGPMGSKKLKKLGKK